MDKRYRCNICRFIWWAVSPEECPACRLDEFQEFTLKDEEEENSRIQADYDYCLKVDK